jgi:hypothetical protein
VHSVHGSSPMRTHGSSFTRARATRPCGCVRACEMRCPVRVGSSVRQGANAPACACACVHACVRVRVRASVRVRTCERVHVRAPSWRACARAGPTRSAPARLRQRAWHQCAPAVDVHPFAVHAQGATFSFLSHTAGPFSRAGRLRTSPSRSPVLDSELQVECRACPARTRRARAASSLDPGPWRWRLPTVTRTRSSASESESPGLGRSSAAALARARHGHGAAFCILGLPCPSPNQAVSATQAARRRCCARRVFKFCRACCVARPARAGPGPGPGLGCQCDLP